MLRYEKFTSMLRTAALALVLALVPAGCAYGQTDIGPCFQTDPTNFSAWEGNQCEITAAAGTVTYIWNSVTDSPAGYVCDSNVGCPLASDINVSQKPTGNSTCGVDGIDSNEDYTILWIQSTSKLNLTSASQYIHLTFNGTVSINPVSSNTHSNWNWPHFDCISPNAGQSGGGVEENKTTVMCGSNCSTHGYSDILCDAYYNGMSDPPQCEDEPITDYNSTMNYKVQFIGNNVAYPLQIEIDVTVPPAGETAYIYSVGTHIDP